MEYFGLIGAVLLLIWLAIIIFTVVIRVLMTPLMLPQQRSAKKMQELQPKIKALRSKYKKAKQDIEQRRKLNEETMRLYKEHGCKGVGEVTTNLPFDDPLVWHLFGFYEQAELPLGEGRHAWVQMARGRARLNGVELGRGDGAALSDESTVRLEGLEEEWVDAGDRRARSRCFVEPRQRHGHQLHSDP